MRIILAVMAFWIADLHAQENFTVKGNIPGYKDGMIFMTHGTFQNSQFDSTAVKNGKFTFKGKLSEPMPAMLFSKDYQVRLDFYVDKGTVTVEAAPDASSGFRVKGSPTVNEFQTFNEEIMSNRKRVMAIFEKEYQTRQSGDTVSANALRTEGDSLYRYEFAIRKKFVKQHPASHISASELLAMSDGRNLAEATQLFDAFAAGVKNSAKGREVSERIALLTRTATGQQAIGFTQNDVNDNPVSLDAYKGKYVLLEFWASWCGPCRAENPNLKEQFAVYHPKGFDVLGISLDNSKENWVKAIEKDGLTWTQVSDLKGWNNAVASIYGIKAIPANYLIDPSGKIVAQNLRGDDLNKKLKEIFN